MFKKGFNRTFTINCARIHGGIATMKSSVRLVCACRSKDP